MSILEHLPDENVLYHWELIIWIKYDPLRFTHARPIVAAKEPSQRFWIKLPM